MFYYALLAPERFGAQHDDSIYATTAKALATGQGYRIISLPSDIQQTKYPPLYPLLLSLIWRVFPEFPQNIVCLTVLSSLTTLVFLLFTYRYLTIFGYAKTTQTLVVVGLAGLNWRTMLLATSIYSEMFYAALSVATLYLAEQIEIEGRRWWHDLLLGVMIGLAFLTRTSGVTLLMSVGLFFVLRRRWSRH
jgi:4-amino-4-deoxy-L-arabinose transferase-like glycosyltransferase